MNKDVLITKEELLKEQFNMVEIKKISDVKEFLLYFSFILRLGIENSIIDENVFNLISSMIINAIENAIITSEDDPFEDSSNQVSNYLYIITIYLREKSNWEAWLELKDLTYAEKADEFVQNVKHWMLKKLTLQRLTLDNIKLSVQKLGMNNVTTFYSYLKKMLNGFMHFDNTAFNFSLKQLHETASDSGNYFFLVTDFDKLPNFYAKLSRMISNFSAEVSILEKINANDLTSKKQNEAELIMQEHQKQSNFFDKKYEEAFKKLHDEYVANLQYYYNSMHKPGRKKKGLSDEVEIYNKYIKDKKDLEDKLQNESLKLLNSQTEEDNVIFSLLDENYSLIDLIKEYAIFGFATEGIITYPTTTEARGKMLLSIKIEVAIAKFIDMNKDILTDVQINYLKKGI